MTRRTGKAGRIDIESAAARTSLDALRGMLTVDGFDVGEFIAGECGRWPRGQRWSFLVRVLRATLTRDALLGREWTALGPELPSEWATPVQRRVLELLGRNGLADAIGGVAVRLLCTTEAVIGLDGMYRGEPFDFGVAVQSELLRLDVDEELWAHAAAVLIEAVTEQHAERLVLFAAHGLLSIQDALALYAGESDGNGSGGV